MKRSPAGSAFLLLVVILGNVPGFASVEPGPRPVSEAERAAVAIVARYLANGPEAFAEALAAGSPLRAIAPDAAIREIEVRTGPRPARWHLQTVPGKVAGDTAVFGIEYRSGIDETLTMRFVREGEELKLDSLSVLAEPSTRTLPRFGEESVAAVEAEERFEPKTLVLPLGVAASLLAFVALPLVRRWRQIGRTALAAAIVIAAASFALAVRFDDRFLPQTHGERPGGSRDAVDFPRSLGSAVDYRMAIARGETMPPEPAMLQPHAANAARVWRAQADLQEMRFEAVTAALDSFPVPSDIPLVEILRARAAAFQAREVDAVLAYERAIDLGPGRDGLWLEIAQSLGGLGFEDRAKKYFRRLPELGSREGVAYYIIAALEAYEERDEAASSALRQAWILQPLSRQSLVGFGPLHHIVKQSGGTPLVDFSSPHEPVVRSAAIGTRRLEFPREASCRVVGELLDVSVGDSDLTVPGGAALAPEGAAVVDARSFEQADEEKALNDLPQLFQASQTPAVFSSPAMRARIYAAVEALARRNRWSEIVEVTSNFSPRSESIALEVLLTRAEALKRSGRIDEAKALLVDLAKSPVVKRKSDPMLMLRLGQMMAATDLYKPAVKMLERAASRPEMPNLDDEIRRILTNERLATSYQEHRTAHFVVRFPPDVDRTQAMKIGEILEAELVRLRRTIPVDSFQPVTVNVLSWKEFRSVYTQSDHILGFYDGKITLPVAGVPRFVPEVVAVITHELAHAMIAQATSDKAPRWFHEGLAQRVQSLKYSRNAFNMYEEPALLALAVLDEVLRSAPDPSMIGQAYIEAQTFIRYLEAVHGRDSIRSLLTAFREGATTEEALLQVTSLSLSAVDESFRKWGRSSDVFITEELVRYDEPDLHFRFEGEGSGSERSPLPRRQQRAPGGGVQ